MSLLPPALVVGSGRGALAVVRSLGRHGVEVWIAGPDGGPPAASRHARGFLRTPSPLTDGEAFAGRLRELAGRFRRRAVLIPTDDVTVGVLADQHDLLEEAYRLIGPSAAVAHSILDKARQYELLGRAGISLPRTWVPEGGDAAERIAAEARFPVVVKPRFSQRFFIARRIKGTLAKTPLELAAALDAFPEPMLVQEQVEGGIENGYEYSSFVGADGRVAVSLLLRKRDNHPRPYGNTTAVETVRVPALERLARRVLEALEYRGISQSEFKLEATSGEFRFIEINARVVNNTAIELAAGADTVYPAYAEAAGLRVGRAEPRGTRTVWLCPELRLPYSRTLLPPPALPDSLPGPTRYVTDLFDPSDPGPLARKALAAARERLAGTGRRLVPALMGQLSMRVQLHPRSRGWLALHRLITLPGQLAGRIALHRGRGPDGGEITVATMARPKFLAPLLAQVFREPPHSSRGGWRALLRPDGRSAGADLVAVRVHPWLVARYRRADWAVSPWNLRFTCDLSRAPSGAGAGSSLKDDLRKVRRYGYALEVVEGAAGLQEFYAKMYLPHMGARFGHENLLPVRGLARRGRVLFVVRDGTRVAGALAVPREDGLWVPRVGVLYGSRKLMREGAMAAVYALSITWARERGFERMDWGHALLFEDDGVHRFKRKWGFDREVSPLGGWIAVRASTAAGRKALAAIGLDPSSARGSEAPTFRGRPEVPRSLGSSADIAGAAPSPPFPPAPGSQIA